MEAAPILDPRLEYISVSKLRALNATELRRLARPVAIILTDQKEPAAVLIPYEIYMNMQAIYIQAVAQVMSLQQKLVDSISDFGREVMPRA